MTNNLQLTTITDVRGEVLMGAPRRKPDTQKAKKVKVFWSESERAAMTNHAIQIQSERPDLGGMALLRAAMMVLQPSRRRKLITVTQAPWFEVSLRAEVERRTIRQREKADVSPAIMATANYAGRVAESAESLNELHEKWKDETTAWRERMERSLDNNNKLLADVCRELRILNAKFDSAVPQANGQLVH